MKQRAVGDVVILTPKGYLTGGDETTELQETIAQCAELGNKHLLICLSETKMIKSTALGVLISAHSNYVRRGGRLKICQVDRYVENVFIITKLSLVFDIYPDEASALRSFQPQVPIRK